jgi:hypothetical protein
MYFLGGITSASGAANSQGAGFVIPQGAKSLYLMPSASGVQFEFGRHTGATGSTFQTTDQRGAFLDGPGLVSGPFRVVQGPGVWTVVGIYNTTGGTVSVRVYASPTS